MRSHGLLITAVVCYVGLCGILMAEVPPDLVEAARFQQKNKGLLVQKMQQRAAGMRQQGNAAAAKQLTEEIEFVRANKVLVLPPLGEASDQIGTIEVEQVLEKTDEGVRVQTSLPRYESTGVSVNTGRQVRSNMARAMGGVPVFYPEKLNIRTQRSLAPGMHINVRRCEGGVVEIPDSEMQAAAELLKKK